MSKPATQYTFKLPVSEAEVTWRPLLVQDQLDVEARHAKEPYLQNPMLIAARVVKQVDKDGEKNGMSLGTLRALDVEDYNALAEEIQVQESGRRASLRTKAAESSTTLQQLEAAIESATAAATGLNRALGAVLEAARADELARTPLA